MDRFEEASFIVKSINKYQLGTMDEPTFIKNICSYFDRMKKQNLTSSDLKFLKYISNMCGIPHYYDLMVGKFGHEDRINDFDLNTLSSSIYESTLHVDAEVKIHKYQKQVLSLFNKGCNNRYFLSATTSFGKTYLIYEIIKRMEYNNVILIFPTIALLSENYERLILSPSYKFFKEKFNIHTLSDANELGDSNIFVFTPERYLSFMDKHQDINVDFVFVDEIYKIDNEFVIDSINVENERDTAYRVALQSILNICHDVLLAGPYIELPNKDNVDRNQSFNIFLKNNNFSVIDYNKYEIVNKNQILIGNRFIKVDDDLTIDLKGYSKKKKSQQLAKIIRDIRYSGENVILYSKGPGMAEKYANGVITESNEYNSKISLELESFINHLSDKFDFDNWIVIESLKNKIGIHHGLVPKYIQKEIVDFFNRGDLDVLVTTTTITEGVNTSAKNLLVLNATKGKKILKKFDAKNVAGRAGRFLHHYSGRVLVLDKKFNEIINGEDDEIRHKNFDSESNKNEIDYFITDDEFLTDLDIDNRLKLLIKQKDRGIPDYVMKMYKVISYSDKLTVFDRIVLLTEQQKQYIRNLVVQLQKGWSLDFDGLKVVLSVIQPIITNDNLSFLINNETPIKKGPNSGKFYSTLIYALSAYLSEGFSGTVRYNLSRVDQNGENITVDQAVRDSSKFVFNTLKYQLVKYLGVFNIMYKYYLSTQLHNHMDENTGIDKLLIKLEYNATSEKGRLASDYGVPSSIIEYYDQGENQKLIEKFDEFESKKFNIIQSILN
ncbi:DEAD/DEAH box helicase family protein [Vibrio fluvialis]|nr:DEAD/DEAH box helicase family protein [Vibrio fluvialis]MBY8011395.1 DEAD/DEAH box helicase family protein [Vibrio fluvialis]MBY8015881.1 DEAD/DEAH box helicase family protein [Vibrio fluvialis]MBY8062017.1 DEAD/DEAH box helicase family protein [Vibrio fluvialis]